MANISNELIAKIEDALNDEAFIGRIVELRNVEEVKAIFLEKSIEVDDEIANAVISKLENYKATGELSEDDLEMVSGGGKLGAIALGCTIGGLFTAGAVVTWPIAIMVGSAVAIAGIIYSDLKKKR